jgi:hypothetical protein
MSPAFTGRAGRFFPSAKLISIALLLGMAAPVCAQTLANPNAGPTIDEIVEAHTENARIVGGADASP